jgi:hypothetical protein
LKVARINFHAFVISYKGQRGGVFKCQSSVLTGKAEAEGNPDCMMHSAWNFPA